MAFRLFGKTTSGLPGNDRSFVLQLTPSNVTIWRTCNSGVVARLLMAAMRRLMAAMRSGSGDEAGGALGVLLRNRRVEVICGDDRPTSARLDLFATCQSHTNRNLCSHARLPHLVLEPVAANWPGRYTSGVCRRARPFGLFEHTARIAAT